MARQQHYIGYFVQESPECSAPKKFVLLGKQLAGSRTRAVDLFRAKNCAMKVNGLYLPGVELHALNFCEHCFFGIR